MDPSYTVFKSVVKNHSITSIYTLIKNIFAPDILAWLVPLSWQLKHLNCNGVLITGSHPRKKLIKDTTESTFTTERSFDPRKLDSLMKCLLLLAILAEGHDTMELFIVFTTRLTAKLIHFLLK